MSGNETSISNAIIKNPNPPNVTNEEYYKFKALLIDGKNKIVLEAYRRTVSVLSLYY